MLRFAAAALVALALTPFASARGGAGSCSAGYSYSGIENSAAATGVTAAIRFGGPATIEAGHVAAWVGVGGDAMGPGGSSEWLQAGIALDAGGQAELYYEVRRPQDDGATYAGLAPVDVGETHRFTVAEVQPDVWIAAIDGVRVSPRVSLPGSRLFAPIATAESWDGGVTGVCNRYAFEFTNLFARSASGTRRAFDAGVLFHDPGYVLALRTNGFAAASR